MLVQNATLAVRRPELEQVLEACKGGKDGALVVGDAGVGKTALAREAAEIWTRDGGRVIWIGGTESSSRFTFGALVGVASILDPADFIGSAKLFLESVVGANGVLVVVDDAHLLDPASATLVHRLALMPDRIALLVTMDPSQPSPDAIRRLAKDRLLGLIELGPFTRETAAKALAGILGGHVEHPTCDRLFELSGGNPYLLRELVSAGTLSGVLTEKNGAWSWRGDVPANPRLNDLVALRLAKATPEVHRMLELLCLSEPLTLEQLTDAVGAEVVATAESADLVQIERLGDSAEVRFTHALCAQLVRAGLGQVRTRQAYQLLEKVLGNFPVHSSADRLKRAAVRLESPDRRPDDAETFTEASRLARPDYELAERFARAALDAGGGFNALDYLVDALLWQGKVDDAKQVVEMVTTDLTTEERAYFSLRWARMLWWITGERPDGVVEAEANSAGLSATARLASIARQAAMAATAGRGPIVVSTALEVLADGDADDEARCWAAGAAMIGLGSQGRVGEALRLSETAFECARRIADFNYRLLLSILEIWLCRLSGNLQQAQSRVDELRRELESRPDPNAGLVALSEAEVVVATGRIRDAIPLLQDAALRLDEIDFGGLSATAHLRLAEALARTGDLPGATDELEKGVELVPRTLEMFRSEQLLIRARESIAVGDLKIARALLSEAETMAAVHGELLLQVHVLHTGVRLGDRGAARRLSLLASAVEGPFASRAVAMSTGWWPPAKGSPRKACWSRLPTPWRRRRSWRPTPIHRALAASPNGRPP
jgi:tetratricopeptide (TPR) repeat protein